MPPQILFGLQGSGRPNQSNGRRNYLVAECKKAHKDTETGGRKGTPGLLKKEDFLYVKLAIQTVQMKTESIFTLYRFKMFGKFW